MGFSFGEVSLASCRANSVFTNHSKPPDREAVPLKGPNIVTSVVDVMSSVELEVNQAISWHFRILQVQIRANRIIYRDILLKETTALSLANYLPDLAGLAWHAFLH